LKVPNRALQLLHSLIFSPSCHSIFETILGSEGTASAILEFFLILLIPLIISLLILESPIKLIVPESESPDDDDDDDDEDDDERSNEGVSPSEFVLGRREREEALT